MAHPAVDRQKEEGQNNHMIVTYYILVERFYQHVQCQDHGGVQLVNFLDVDNYFLDDMLTNNECRENTT